MKLYIKFINMLLLLIFIKKLSFIINNILASSIAFNFITNLIIAAVVLIAYLKLNKKLKIENSIKENFLLYNLVIISIFSFYIISKIRPWPYSRYVFFIYPYILISIIAILNKINISKKYKYYLGIFICSASLFSFNKKNILYLNYDTNSNKKDSTLIFNFLKDENNDTPLIIILNENWRNQREENYNLFNKSFKDWTFVKIMPMLYKKDNIFILEESKLTENKFKEILNEFKNPKLLHVISKNNKIFFKDYFNNIKEGKIRYKNLFILSNPKIKQSKQTRKEKHVKE